MGERLAKNALVSSSNLVLIEAPAGCGKTHLAAEYAKWLAASSMKGRVLILTHTHTAVDVFRGRTTELNDRIQVSTFDGLISQICGIYHKSLGLPQDVTAWAKNEPNGFERLGLKALELLRGAPSVLGTMSLRFPFVLCDEHQDSNKFQHLIVMQLREAGSKIRIFADPMQAIYVRGKKNRVEHKLRWEALVDASDIIEKLDYPYRWEGGSQELGRWILNCRSSLQNGEPIMLGGKRPRALNVIVADNNSLAPGGFSLGLEESRQLRTAVRTRDSIMVLSAQNDLVKSVSAFFGRKIPIWEGHTRESLVALVDACTQGHGRPPQIAHAFRRFLQSVGAGFSDSAFANRLVKEVEEGCARRATGKPQHLQTIADCILQNPSHIGVANALATLDALRRTESAFAGINIDYKREFWEAISLASFPDPTLGLAEITRRRNVSPRPLPDKVVSTVHKAKGMENDHVLVVPCDSETYADTEEKRCLLYVAISRAKRTLTIVASRNSQSPLLTGI